MAGTIVGGKLAAKTNKELYGKSFYRHIGRKGGKTRHPETRPFFADRELAKLAGARGGAISSRKKPDKYEAKRAKAAQQLKDYSTPIPVTYIPTTPEPVKKPNLWKRFTNG